MSRRVLFGIALAAALAAAACEAPTVKMTTTAAPPAPLTPSGPSIALALEQGPAAEAVQAAASVVRVDQLPGEIAKLFGTAGGDPAMNGLYAHIAFYLSPADGWAIYRIGDVLDYTIRSHANGRVDLDIHESTMDEAGGAIGDRHRKIIVQWTQGPNDIAPTAVTVTPAQ